MKAATIILALAGAVMAQNMEGQPACATSCLISAISAAGCAPSDVGCQCGPTQSAISTLGAPCLIKACSANPADLFQAQSAGASLCSKYSATATKTHAQTTSTGGATTGSNAGAGTTPTPTGTGTGAAQTSTSTTATGNNAATTPMALGLAALLGAVAAL